ncbi:MAG: FapA family protein [Pseudomonadota bacterium]
MSSQAKHIDIGVKLAPSEDGKYVVAELAPLNGKGPPSLSLLKKEIARQGFGDALIVDAQLTDMLKRWKTEQEIVQFKIGQITDAIVSVDISKNKLEAYLTIEKALGGKRATLETVLAEMKKEGLKYGVVADAVKQAVAVGEATHVLIAKGRTPVHGERAQFIVLVKDAADRRPNIKDDGSVNYRDILNVLTVKSGEPLMRRVPATRGIKGIDVKGRELPAKDGKDVPYSSRLKNVTFLEQDKNILVAAIAGQPVVEIEGMSVDPTLSVETVDISTGNLEFDGTVMIKGDVLTGMSVKVTGDVHIAGMVEASSVTSGGDIIIAGGVIGRGEVRAENGKLNESAATLKAGGNVQARFVENAIIEAKKDVYVKDLIAHSEVKAEGCVCVGGKGSPKGQIIGGVVEGRGGVEAVNMGTAGGVITRIRVGAPLSPLKEKLRDLEFKLQHNQLKMKQIQEVMAQLAQKPSVDEATLKKGHATEALLEADAATFIAEINAVNASIKLLSNAKAVAKQHLYGGVELTFFDKARMIKDDQGPAQFQFDGGAVIKK